MLILFWTQLTGTTFYFWNEIFTNLDQFFEAIPVNQISTYKFDGEFFEKISSKNIITKKKWDFL